MSPTTDDDDPQNLPSALALALDVLGDLSRASRSDLDALKRRATEAMALLTRRRDALRGVRGRARERQRAGDEWIFDIFRSIESAVPRETLLQDFVDRYRRDRQAVDVDRHAGPWLFVFERIRDGSGQVEVLGRASVGVHPNAFDAQCAIHLAQASEDPYLRHVLWDGADIAAWHGSWWERPSPLFEALLDVPRRFVGEPNYWVSATLLPGDYRNNAQAIFIFYPNAGEYLAPETPAGMRQDQRLLMALALAWRHLEHQVLTLARLSERDRRDLLNLIAPGLLHHELGHVMRTLYGQAFEQFYLLRDSIVEPTTADVGLAIEYGSNVGHLALHAYQVTDVFNNLDKRGRIETSNMDRILEDVRLLLHHRLGQAGTGLVWDHDSMALLDLHTDVVLLQHALINIVTNALNAMAEAETPPLRFIKVVLATSTADSVELRLMNNGPPIEPSLAKDIFLRGYTTRRDGHGQGLYLVRLIAHYLGGQAALLDRAALSTDMFVGFQFQFRRRLQAEEGLARVTT